ncbi:hypothetical protein SH591_15030 [Sphingomonas sp. LY54]|uniref:hypothetical protein n=1 Tax=Sphingomonas sp. LY54 TaxID=3095343 RepID=UPI002D78F596|nr:hypothetical protein [Sphingomonas sp. LY54]WRP28394.1 hypothetical protein SH591_15030 [Sphingomonas sp. LY54]
MSPPAGVTTLPVRLFLPLDHDVLGFVASLGLPLAPSLAYGIMVLMLLLPGDMRGDRPGQAARDGAASPLSPG